MTFELKPCQESSPNSRENSIFGQRFMTTRNPASSARAAADAGVIYSMAFGDQPALVCDLIDWARTCGFEVAAAGRGHKWRPEYRFSTPDTIWDHWGLSPEVAARGRLNPKMFNSFLDGTKPAIESAAIANACGLDVPSGRLVDPPGTIDDIPTLMRPKTEGGVLEDSRPGGWILRTSIY